MSNKREREKRRQERLQQENRVDSADRRAKLLQMAAGAAFLVVAVVVVLIVVSSSNSDDGGDAANLDGVAEVERELSGIPQDGMVIGDAAAPVEVVEFGDLQCPACKAFAEEVVPPVIENQVKSGAAKLAFHNFTIIGPESLTAGAAALAAGEQGKGWNFVELFYKNQGAENDGYVTDEFLTAIAEEAGVADIARWNEERKSKKLEAAVEATTAEAQRLGLGGTPTFAIKGPGTDGLEVIDVGSTGDLEAAIEAAS